MPRMEHRAGIHLRGAVLRALPSPTPGRGAGDASKAALGHRGGDRASSAATRQPWHMTPGERTLGPGVLWRCSHGRVG